MADLTVSGVSRSATEADAYATINQFLDRRRQTRSGRDYDPTPTHEKPKVETSDSGEVYLRTVDPTTGGFKFTLAGQDPTKKVEDKAATAYSNYQSTVMAELGGDFGEGNIAFDPDRGGVFYRGTKDLAPHHKKRIKNLNEIGVALKNYTKAGVGVHDPTITNLMEAMDISLRGKDVTFTESYVGPEGETVTHEALKTLYPGQSVQKSIKPAKKEDEVIDYATAHEKSTIAYAEANGLVYDTETKQFKEAYGPKDSPDKTKAYQAREVNQALKGLRNLTDESRIMKSGIADMIRDDVFKKIELGITAIETETTVGDVVTKEKKFIQKRIDEVIQTTSKPTKKPSLKKVPEANVKVAESHLSKAKSLFEKGNQSKSEDTYRAYLRQDATNKQFKKDNTNYKGRFAISPRHLPPYTSSQLKKNKAWQDYTSEAGGSYANIYKKWQEGAYNDATGAAQTEKNTKQAFKEGFFKWLQEQQLLNAKYASDFIIAPLPPEWEVDDPGFEPRHKMPIK